MSNQARKEAEKKAFRLIDERAESLRRELAADSAIKAGAAGRAASEARKTIVQLNEALRAKQISFEELSTEEFNLIVAYASEIKAKIEKGDSNSAEADEKLAELLKEMESRVGRELAAEKREREAGEETLLLMLENVCSKMHNLGGNRD